MTAHANHVRRLLDGRAAIFGACEFVGETDPAKLRYILKVKDGFGTGYWWWSAVPATPPGRFHTAPRRTCGDRGSRCVGACHGAETRHDSRPLPFEAVLGFAARSRRGRGENLTLLRAINPRPS
jgi:hypothetical protein